MVSTGTASVFKQSMKKKYILALLDIAERFGQTSTAERLKVGSDT